MWYDRKPAMSRHRPRPRSRTVNQTPPANDRSSHAAPAARCRGGDGARRAPAGDPAVGVGRGARCLLLSGGRNRRRRDRAGRADPRNPGRTRARHRARTEALAQRHAVASRTGLVACAAAGRGRAGPEPGRSRDLRSGIRPTPCAGCRACWKATWRFSMRWPPGRFASSWPKIEGVGRCSGEAENDRPLATNSVRPAARLTRPDP